MIFEHFDLPRFHLTDVLSTCFYYQGRKAASRNSRKENRSILAPTRVVEIVPVRVVEIVPVRVDPLAVVEIVPVLVVEMVPVFVVEMVPVFPKLVTDKALNNNATETIN